MNPMEWLKAAYGAFGVKYPILSYIVVMVTGAILAGFAWFLVSSQYQNSLARQPIVATTPANIQTGSTPQVRPKENTGEMTGSTGNASTSAPNSPAITGSGNTVIYEGHEKTKVKKPENHE